GPGARRTLRAGRGTFLLLLRVAPGVAAYPKRDPPPVASGAIDDFVRQKLERIGDVGSASRRRTRGFAGQLQRYRDPAVGADLGIQIRGKIHVPEYLADHLQRLLAFVISRGGRGRRGSIWIAHFFLCGGVAAPFFSRYLRRPYCWPIESKLLVKMYKVSPAG